MKLGINTFLYELAKYPFQKTLESVKNLGFQYVDVVAYNSLDPTRMTAGEKKNFLNQFKDLGLVSSQLLMIGTRDIASPDSVIKKKTMDYMKKCADLQLLLGGKQVLVCWGGGIYDVSLLKAQSWINSVVMIHKYAEWAKGQGILISLEMDPHVFFVVNNMEKMARFLEDIQMPNVFPNVDIGHLCITREAPHILNKFKDRILHVHISETSSFEHTNSIIGSGVADFRAYVDQTIELGIEETCQKYGEVAVAAIEMGDPNIVVDDPERWIQQSLLCLRRVLPEITV
ncbi:MAG: sugar phosphate isomerase/epimerase [Atribacterota bacterium]